MWHSIWDEHGYLSYEHRWCELSTHVLGPVEEKHCHAMLFSNIQHEYRNSMRKASFRSNCSLFCDHKLDTQFTTAGHQDDVESSFVWGTFYIPPFMRKRVVLSLNRAALTSGQEMNAAFALVTDVYRHRNWDAQTGRRRHSNDLMGVFTFCFSHLLSPNIVLNQK